MSKMSSIRKPPLPKSPVRLRPRRILRSVTNSLQTPPGSLTKSEKLNRNLNTEKSDLRPEYQSMSCELRALAKIARQEFGEGELNEIEKANNLGVNASPVFERGRFYEEYSARRNARLKRKKGETEDDGKTPYCLGVATELTKRKDSKKLQSLRKSVCVAYTAEREIDTPRYMLRSMTKESRKPPLAVSSSKPVIGGDRKTGSSRIRRS